MTQRAPIFAANWKMNKLKGEIPEFIAKLTGLLADAKGTPGKHYQVVIVPPAVYLADVVEGIRGKGFGAGVQNGGPAKSGAFTGEVSPVMVKDLGGEWALVGHSERRHVFKEDDALVLSRLKAAWAEGLSVILCVGETLADRRAGNTFSTVETQLGILKDHAVSGEWERLVVAYEPVWAIGTGENATPQQAQEVHAFIRNWMTKALGPEGAARVRILYGGSVKPENSGALMGEKDVDGLLVGGASLDPAVFAGVIRNGLQSRS